MEYRVLGPLEVLGPDGVAVNLGGPRQRIVLALLLLEAPHVVPVERLVDAVWPDAPPSTARSQIQICVSSLRQRLDPAGAAGVIATRRPGYAIEAEDLDLDWKAFQLEVARGREAAERGRLTEAAEHLGRALDRWRGAPLSGIDSRRIQDAAVRMEEERARAVEELAEIELSSGRHRELVPVLRQEVDRYPLREQLRGQLMRALYRSGRQADALQEFRRARALSVEELGIEPSEPLRRIEQAILREDRSLITQVTPVGRSPGPTVPRMLPPTVADFTGRSDAVTAVGELLDGRAGGERGAAPAVVVLTGQGGIGKSALAVHLAHRMEDRFPDGRLFASLHGATHSVPAAEVLARFLRALGVPGAAVPESLDERAELYRDRLAGRAVLVVLDDAGQEAQVLPLLPPGAGSAVLITSRRRLTALPGTDLVELPSLELPAAVSLLRRVVGPRVDADPAAAAELVRLCGHLPLALRIAAARLAARPHWSLRTMVERLTDESGQLDELRHGDMAVRGSLMLSYDTLDPAARRLLRMLALIDSPNVGAWACAVLIDTDSRTAQDRLDELVELHLVVVELEEDGGGARYRLHDLVRLFGRERAVAEDPAPVRAATIDRYLGALLGLTELAHSCEYGGEFLIVHGPAPRCPVDEQVRREVVRQPLLWLSRERQALVSAVAQAATAGFGAVCWDLAVSAVVLFEAHALFDDWNATHELGLAAALRDGDRLGEAVMRYSRGSMHLFERHFGEAEADLAVALALFTELGEDEGRAMAVRNQAFIDRMRGNHGRGRERSEEALRLFRRSGDLAGEAHVLSNLAQIALETGDAAGAEECLRTAGAICARIPNRRIAAQVEHRLGLLQLEQRDGVAAEGSFLAVLRFATDAGDRIAEAHAQLGLGRAKLLTGALAEATAAFARAEELTRKLAEPPVRAGALLAMSEAALKAQDVPGALERAVEALEVAAGLELPMLTASCLAARGDAEAAAGDPAAAARSWTAALDRLDAVTAVGSARLADELRGRLAAWSVAADAR